MSQAFFTWLEGPFLQSLPAFAGPSLRPARTAILVVDLVRGFCHLGPLASPRVEALVPRVRAFLEEAQRRGVAQFWFCCDEHQADSPEFQSFPPHCVAGTAESELHPHLEGFPGGLRFAKGSLNALLEPELERHLQSHAELEHFILVGDCTDLCIYSAAMHLRMQANRAGLSRQVWVLADLVDTYDLPLDLAQGLGAMPHPGDLCHAWGLYQMRLNGCQVVRYSSISA